MQPHQLTPPTLPQPSILQQTLQQIQSRVHFFSQHNISAQNSLNPTSVSSIRSISQIITPLKYFDICQTPLSMNLGMIYANEMNKNALKWTIMPPSQGEDSINQQEVFEPSFRWLTSTMIDPNLLQLDQPQPTRIQKGKIPQQWCNITQLLLFNVSTKIYLKSQLQQIQKSIKKKFSQRYSWLKYKRIRQIYYKGKPCVILKFGDANSASFVYYSFATFKSNREQFGQNCEIYRVNKNDTREYSKQKNWILIMFRHLPLSMTKEQLIGVFKQQDVGLKWVEELVEIAGAKYTIGKVSYLDQALLLCSVFNGKKFRDAKVNLHPKSSKNWKAEEVMRLEQEVDVRMENETLERTIQRSY